MLQNLAASVLATILISPGSTLASDRQSPPNNVAYLLANVCLPYVEHERSESEVTKNARLRGAHVPYWPQIKPKGLNQYAGPYDGISVVNIHSLQNICDMHARGGDFADFEASVANALSTTGEIWTSSRTVEFGFVHGKYCNASRGISVQTFEADPAHPSASRTMKRDGPSFDVSVISTPCSPTSGVEN